MGGQTWVPQFFMVPGVSLLIPHRSRSWVSITWSAPSWRTKSAWRLEHVVMIQAAPMAFARNWPGRPPRIGKELQENPTLSGQRWWEKQKTQELLESSMKTRDWLANWPWKTQAIYKALVPLPTGCPCDRCHHFRPAPVPLCLGFGNAQHHALRRSETQAMWAPPWAWRLLRACLGRISPWNEDIKQIWPSPWPQEFIDPIFKRGF